MEMLPAHYISADYVLQELIDDDFLAPDQYIKTRVRNIHWQPELRLLFVVLQDAVQTFQRYLGTERRKHKVVFNQVREWIWSDDSDQVFSFTHICDVFALDPGYIRKALSTWETAQRAARETQGTIAQPKHRPARHNDRVVGRRRAVARRRRRRSLQITPQMFR